MGQIFRAEAEAESCVLHGRWMRNLVFIIPYIFLTLLLPVNRFSLAWTIWKDVKLRNGEHSPVCLINHISHQLQSGLDRVYQQGLLPTEGINEIQYARVRLTSIQYSARILRESDKALNQPEGLDRYWGGRHIRDMGMALIPGLSGAAGIVFFFHRGLVTRR